MKKALVIAGILALAALIYYFISNHFYYLFFSGPETESNQILTKTDLDELQGYLDYRNQSKDFPDEHSPVIVGVYNGTNVVEQYWCNDACPDNGILYLNYASSTEETCDEFSGIKLTKFGWGSGYIGCSPTENKFSY